MCACAGGQCMQKKGVWDTTQIPISRKWPPLKTYRELLTKKSLRLSKLTHLRKWYRFLFLHWHNVLCLTSSPNAQAVIIPYFCRALLRLHKCVRVLSVWRRRRKQVRSVHIEMSGLISSRERDKMGRSSSVLSKQQALPHTAGFPLRPSHVRLTGLEERTPWDNIYRWVVCEPVWALNSLLCSSMIKRNYSSDPGDSRWFNTCW